MRIAVIGRGLIGAAAARHLSLLDHEVILIGPPEPVDKARHQGVFASHYDEGRITRKLDAHPFWSSVASASIARYDEIEAASGISFFAEVGALMAAPQDSVFAANVRTVRDSTGIATDMLNQKALQHRFPYFAFPDGTQGFHEPQGAGHISPRRLILAQCKAAAANGVKIIEKEVIAVHETKDSAELRLADQTLQVDQVLLAAGAFTNALLDVPLDLKIYARTVAFFELDPDEAKRLAAMPTLIYRFADGRDPYLLPPIVYPDGKTYLKLGGDPVDRVLGTPEQIKDWFRSDGDAKVGEFLHAMICEMMPGLRIKSRHLNACVTMFTEHGLPYIDRLSAHVSVATGGCGAGAKCSDELGRLGALAVLGQTDPALHAVFERS